eukprot:TRINITY_DN13101_c0_g3_i1.p1 TRINITY_DN13101_c0_g3~~TRINITY_DN13101_c0_g3_i1.p1  ORF type:complete len:111 (+),score=3.92 TRINITY_DN13101_c0_g3_i1:721-1053(+)
MITTSMRSGGSQPGRRNMRMGARRRNKADAGVRYNNIHHDTQRLVWQQDILAVPLYIPNNSSSRRLLDRPTGRTTETLFKKHLLMALLELSNLRAHLIPFDLFCNLIAWK